MGGPDCPSEERIDGKTVVITGASGGIGRETALELARRGGRIVLAVKDELAGEKVAQEIRALPNGKADVKVVDLSSLDSVRSFAESLGKCYAPRVEPFGSKLSLYRFFQNWTTSMY